jgi:mRNA interferase RelE/StbE
MRQIEWSQKALRRLRKIKNRQEQAELYTSVAALENYPHCNNVKKIQTTEMYRLRVGNWRVIFTDSLEIVTIEEVKKRNERTYK